MHLHPRWQQLVLGQLGQAFPLLQFIVTTHSPQVLSTVPSESIRILANNSVYSAPPGTEGAEASRLLKRVLGVDVRPPDNKATRELKEYLSLVDADQWNSTRAIALRNILDARYQGEEPALLEADLQIENRKWELEQ
jgi:predicted ATP-binding protein involved in virulence